MGFLVHGVQPLVVGRFAPPGAQEHSTFAGIWNRRSSGSSAIMAPAAIPTRILLARRPDNKLAIQGGVDFVQSNQLLPEAPVAVRQLPGQSDNNY